MNVEIEIRKETEEIVSGERHSPDEWEDSGMSSVNVSSHSKWFWKIKDSNPFMNEEVEGWIKENFIHKKCMEEAKNKLPDDESDCRSREGTIHIKYWVFHIEVPDEVVRVELPHPSQINPKMDLKDAHHGMESVELHNLEIGEGRNLRICQMTIPQSNYRNSLTGSVNYFRFHGYEEIRKEMRELPYKISQIREYYGEEKAQEVINWWTEKYPPIYDPNKVQNFFKFVHDKEWGGFILVDEGDMIEGQNLYGDSTNRHPFSKDVERVKLA